MIRGDLLDPPDLTDELDQTFLDRRERFVAREEDLGISNLDVGDIRGERRIEEELRFDPPFDGEVVVLLDALGVGW